MNSKKRMILHGVKIPEHKGIMKNLTKNGLGIISGRIYPPGKPQVVRIFFEDERDFNIRGQIVWVLDPPEFAKDFVKAEMGMKILKYDPIFLKYLEKMEANNKRRYKRYEEALKVAFTKGGRYYEGITKDISAGGIFIHTDLKLNPGEKFDFELVLPHTQDKIVVRGEVMYVISEISAKQMGILPGVGVKIVDFERGHKLLFDVYLNDIKKRYEFVS